MMDGRVLVKDGVLFTIVAPSGYCILAALKAAACALKLNLTITSACDGEHSGPNDPHRLGKAYDVRSHDLEPHVRAKVLSAVMAPLGWDRFYGFLEDQETSNEHFHFQQAKDTVFSLSDWLSAA